jgi:predicted DNA repair protein MutK
VSGGLVALLDDVAALVRVAAASVDDVAAGAAKAGAKAAGVVIDDAAVTPQYVSGSDPSRELPMIKKIFWGSLRNKLLIILPALLLVSAFIPWAIPFILMLGGTYLCYEGAEKVWHKLRGGHSEEEEAPAVERGPEAEAKVTKGAITTDFILSCEIMVISMNEVADESIWARAIILVVVAFAITILVYGAVALIVKMDDIGLHLTTKDSAGAQRFGEVLVKGMPAVLGAITFIGTIAMLWVGGHIMLQGAHDLGWHAPYDLVHVLESPVAEVAVVGGFLAWLVNTLCSAVLGLAWGLVVMAILHPLLKVLPFGKGKNGHEEGHGSVTGQPAKRNVTHS